MTANLASRHYIVAKESELKGTHIGQTDGKEHGIGGETSVRHQRSVRQEMTAQI